MVADGGELGQGLGDHPGLAPGDEHPDERGHPRVQLLPRDRGGVLVQALWAEVEEERARVARGAAQRAGAGARVGQRGRVPRGGAAGGAGGGRGRGRVWGERRRGRGRGRRAGTRGEGEAQARRGSSLLGVGLGRRRVCGGGGVVAERDRAVVVRRKRERAVGVVTQGAGEGDGGFHCVVLCL